MYSATELQQAEITDDGNLLLFAAPDGPAPELSPPGSQYRVGNGNCQNVGEVKRELKSGDLVLCG
jgi:hypothetical protein